VSKIEDIASQHLGKAGDGSVVKPYVTPDSVDASLLVPIPRKLNRDQYNIEEHNLPFIGYDTWNCYEFSFLLDSGYPVSGILKIVYPCDSKYIVESKSIKLYLNSFNMMTITGDYIEAINEATALISHTLSKALETTVKVYFHVKTYGDDADFMFGQFEPLEEAVDIEKDNFNYYNEDPNILKKENKGALSNFAVKTNALRSNCRVTNQPDWGDVFIIVKGEEVPTKLSLLQYIISMRKENHFHEEICECIFKRLYTLLPKAKILVACLYTRRGGIDINPVRTNDINLMSETNLINDLIDYKVPFTKTARQ
jgi:7-cyano-7-deazaguanine reductase